MCFCVLFQLLQHEKKLRCSATRMLKLSPERPVHGVFLRGGLIRGCGCADLRGLRQRKPPSSQSAAHRFTGRLSIQVEASVAISSIKRAALSSSLIRPAKLQLPNPSYSLFWSPCYLWNIPQSSNLKPSLTSFIVSGRGR